MPRLPDVQEMGARPVPESRRQIATVRNAGAVGGAVSRLGEKGLEVVEQLERVSDEADVRRNDTLFEDEVAPIRERALSVRGEHAGAARMAADAEIERLTRGALARARSPRARQALEPFLRGRANELRRSIATHATNETASFLDGQFSARRDVSVRRAQDVWDQPEAAERHIAIAVGEVANRGEWRGWSREQVLAEQQATVSTIRSGIAERMLSAGDYDGAERYIDAHRGEIDHQAENALRTVIRGSRIQTEAETTVSSLPAVTGVAAAPDAGGDATSALTGAPAELAAGLQAGVVAGRRLSPAVIAGALGNAAVELPSWNPRGPNSSGDGGTAHGQFQWRQDRVTNFRREIGVHPRDATPTQAAQFFVWEMNNPRAAGMTVAQRNAILNARTAAEAASLIDEHYERSDGRAREQRVAAAERFAGRATSPTGRFIDYAQARREIDALNLDPDRRRATIAELERRISAEGRVRELQGQEIEQQVTQRLAQIASSGGRLTNINQIDGGLIARATQFRPQIVTQLYGMIDANNRREPEANSPLMNNLIIQAATDPNTFLREVNPELYRGRVTDAEVQQLVQMRLNIGQRTGPQPSAILGVINFVLPETGLIPRVDPNAREGARRQQAETQQQTRQRVTASLLAAVQRRLQLQHGRAEITQNDILTAVRAEVTMTTLGVPIFQAREQGATQFPIAIPSIALPAIVQMLARAGLPNTPNNRVQVYLQNRDAIDRAVDRGRTGTGSID